MQVRDMSGLTSDGDGFRLDDRCGQRIRTGSNGFIDRPLLDPLPDCRHPLYRDILKRINHPRHLCGQW